MQAIILNSGLGNRMGTLTENKPKCLVELPGGDTILGRQLKQLSAFGINDIIITTGYHHNQITEHCQKLGLPVTVTTVNNEKYAETNYIYSIYLAREHIKEEVILIHGDIVCEDSVFELLLSYGGSRMAISSTVPLPKKDFKAIIEEERVKKVGVDFFDGAVSAQPLYKLVWEDFKIWMSEITQFCHRGDTGCYAENALNNVSESMDLGFVDVGNLLCGEIDTAGDLEVISEKLSGLDKRRVFMSFSADTIHGGHIALLKRAAKIGKVTVGVMTDDVVASYKRFPLVPYEERRILMESISLVDKVVEQDSFSCRAVLSSEKPDFVVHGDDWVTGKRQPMRTEIIEILKEYGGSLIEYPYSKDNKYTDIEKRLDRQSSLPDIRRGKLWKLLSLKPTLRIIEAHSGITGLIAENTAVYQDGKTYQFDGMWISSLCDSTAKGKPDIELVDMSSRFRTVDDIMEVTTKPIILDGDTGGLIEHFVYTVRTLERMGVSAIVIEDKVGLKRNSLFGTDVEQTQDSIENFSAKIAAGKQAQKTPDFMIIARIESLILEQGMDDALKRAFAFVEAGADGIMIHSRRKTPDEIFEFIHKFRAVNKNTPLVVVPTSFNTVTEDEFQQAGANIVIYANHLTRSAFSAMKQTAESILLNHRCKEADKMCLPIKDIITLIPGEI